MKKFFLGVLVILIIAVVAFGVVVAMQPADFRVERTTKINAPVDVVFAQVNDLHKWEDWSPWKKAEPTAKYTYTGPDAGKDASVAWVGEKVGEGRMTIVESDPSKRIKLKLEFLKPMESTHHSEFDFKTEGDQTAVTWSMAGKNGFVEKAFHLVMNFDKMLGDDFEKGLADIKTVSETAKK